MTRTAFDGTPNPSTAAVTASRALDGSPTRRHLPSRCSSVSARRRSVPHVDPEFSHLEPPPDAVVRRLVFEPRQWLTLRRRLARDPWDVRPARAAPISGG